MTPAEEREWNTVRYVLGEMSPAEAESYEAELERGTQSVDLVAETVELTSAIRLAMPSVAPRSQSSRTYRRVARAAGWMAVGAAVCFAALWIPLIGQQRNRTPAVADGAASAAGEPAVAIAWREVVSNRLEESATELAMNLDDTASSLEWEEDGGDYRIPDWMVVGTAVSGGVLGSPKGGVQ